MTIVGVRVPERVVQPELESPAPRVRTLGEDRVPHLVRMLHINVDVGAQRITNEDGHPAHEVIRRQVMHA